jgi:hypothetical protein
VKYLEVSLKKVIKEKDGIAEELKDIPQHQAYT